MKEYFRAVITDIKMAQQYATKLFNSEITIEPHETYWADKTYGDELPISQIKAGDEVYQDYFGSGFASFEETTIFIPDLTVAQYLNLDSSTKNMIALSYRLLYDRSTKF